MAIPRAALLCLLVGGLAVAQISGGSETDPQTPGGLAGMPPPFLGTAVAGRGGLTAAIDAYGDVVDLRAPGPASQGLIDNPSDRQAAGSVPADTGIVPRVRLEGGPALPMWRADSVVQRYLPGTNVVRTVARFGQVTVRLTNSTTRGALALVMQVSAPTGVRVAPSFSTHLEAGLRCRDEREARLLALVCRARQRSAGNRSAEGIVASAIAADHRWLRRALPLGAAAPDWARRMYRRSLLALRALTDSRSGAVAAGARDGWAYVWPRDAATVALALSASGYRGEARPVARFLLGLDLDTAARFDGEGAPVPGRGPQGDAAGWVAIAARAAGLRLPATSSTAGTPSAWRNLPDYQESDPGDYLANAIAATPLAAGVSEFSPHLGRENSDTPSRTGSEGVAGAIAQRFDGPHGLVREAGEPQSGLDSVAAWAVRPFDLPQLRPAVRKTLSRLVRNQNRFGITPGEAWPGLDPWSAPTAWTAWAFAAMAREGRDRPTARADRRRALILLAALRCAATPAGALPERVDVRTGVPRSTTPLAWSHAFAILTLRELWPTR
jgi:glucoamylase